MLIFLYFLCFFVYPDFVKYFNLLCRFENKIRLRSSVFYNLIGSVCESFDIKACIEKTYGKNEDDEDEQNSRKTTFNRKSYDYPTMPFKKQRKYN